MSKPPKPHKEYKQLVDLLIKRNMVIDDIPYAKKKIMEVGYYRLSGFWFISREINSNPTIAHPFSETFCTNTYFKEIYKLYLFDKKLRLLLLDIIERLEVNIRTIIAHELGRNNPLAYKDESILDLGNSKKRNRYNTWKEKLNKNINRNNSEFIQWHKKEGKEIPFWVVIEIWDFGTLSTYYSLLKGKYQNQIAKKFNIDKSILKEWLHQINLLRNDCAHHSRIWNKNYNKINLPDLGKISKDDKTETRIFGRILVLWYLIQQMGSTHYSLLKQINQLIKDKFPKVPNANLKAMGLSSYSEIPVDEINNSFRTKHNN